MPQLTTGKVIRLSRSAALAAVAMPAAMLLIATFAFCQDEAPPTSPPSATADDTGPQPEPAKDEGAKKEGEEEEPVHIENADLMQYDPDKGVYFLTGNVHFRHKDADLYCDEAQYDEENDTARAVGHLKLVTPDTTVTGDLITADFDEEVADVTGNVRLVTQRKKKAEDKEQEGGEKREGTEAEQEDAKAEEGDEKPKKLDEYREKLTTVTCEKIRYWYEEKRAVATGNIVAVQEDKTCYADEGTYLEEEDTLTLIGSPVRVVMENGNSFKTSKVTVDVEGDRIWTGGPFSGIFKREKKEEEGQEQPPAAPAEEQPATEAETPGPPE